MFKLNNPQREIHKKNKPFQSTYNKHITYYNDKTTNDYVL